MFSHHLNRPIRPRYTITVIVPFLIALVVIWLAFDSSGQDATLDSIDDAETAWEVLGIDNYQLVVQEISVWDVTRTRSQVEEGHVIAMHGTCDRGLVGIPCEFTTLDPERATIHGLLAYAREVAAFEERAKWLKVEVQTENGFVLSMGYNDPEILDEDWGLTARVEGGESGGVPTMAPSPTPFATEVPEPTPTPPPLVPETPPEGNIIAWIDQHEAAWDALEMVNYRIEMQVQSDSVLLTVQLELTDNHVTVASASCDSEECALPVVYTRDYRMSGIADSGLFVQARQAAEVYAGSEPAVEMHPDYHFPVVICWDDPAVDDDEWTITVTDFQPVTESDS